MAAEVRDTKVLAENKKFEGEEFEAVLFPKNGLLVTTGEVYLDLDGRKTLISASGLVVIHKKPKKEKYRLSNLMEDYAVEVNQADNAVLEFIDEVEVKGRKVTRKETYCRCQEDGNWYIDQIVREVPGK